MQAWLRANDPLRPLRVARPPYYDEPVSHCPFYAGRNLWSKEDLAEAKARLDDVAAAEGSEADRACLDDVAAAERSEADKPKIPFERLMESLTKHEHSWRLMGTIQRILGYSMLVGRRCAFIAGPDRYDSLLQKIGQSRRLMVVTLNYDVLLEDALERNGLRFAYPSIPGVSGTIFTSGGEGAVVRVYKPHGSINWLAASSNIVSQSREVARETSQPLKLTERGSYTATQSYATYVPPSRVSTFQAFERSHNMHGPVVAIYGAGKHLMANPEHVELHRTDCRRSIAELGEAEVLAIGVRPTTMEDDPVLLGILEELQKLRGLKEYVAPLPNECVAFRNLGFIAHEETFEGWLARALPIPALQPALARHRRTP